MAHSIFAARSTDSETNRFGRPIIQAATAVLLSHVHGIFVHEIVKNVYADDKQVGWIIRAATSPQSMATDTSLVPIISTADFISILGPVAAASVLLKRGLQLQYNGAGGIQIPNATAAAGNATFFQENAPMPVRQFAWTDAPILAPRKFGGIVTFSREVLEESIPNIEAVVRATLNDSYGLALDTALLDSVAGDTVRPAGLRNGISGLTPATIAGAITNRSEALVADVEQMIAQVSAVGGNAPVIFVCSPAQATALKMLPSFPFEILASSALAAKTVIAIASNVLASAIDPVPRLAISTQATLHMDTTPSQITTGGGTPAFSSPVRSTFQTDTIGLRLIAEVSWGLRSVTGLAWMTNVLW